MQLQLCAITRAINALNILDHAPGNFVTHIKMPLILSWKELDFQVVNDKLSYYGLVWVQHELKLCKFINNSQSLI